MSPALVDRFFFFFFMHCITREIPRTYLRTIFHSLVIFPLFFSSLDMVRCLVSNVVDIKVPYYIIDF